MLSGDLEQDTVNGKENDIGSLSLVGISCVMLYVACLHTETALPPTLRGQMEMTETPGFHLLLGSL